MGELTVEGINPVLVDSFWNFLWAIRGSRWEVTCGLCRTRFRDTGWMLRSWVRCPACGTRNIVRSEGPRRRL
jgi:DNA-directed RNA polymerase subunit RPC12/RpoP